MTDHERKTQIIAGLRARGIFSVRLPAIDHETVSLRDDSVVGAARWSILIMGAPVARGNILDGMIDRFVKLVGTQAIDRTLGETP